MNHLTEDDLARLRSIDLQGKFKHLRCVFAAFDRRDFTEAGLIDRLGEYVERSAAPLRVSRKLTINGLPVLPVLWGEP